MRMNSYDGEPFSQAVYDNTGVIPGSVTFAQDRLDDAARRHAVIDTDSKQTIRLLTTTNILLNDILKEIRYASNRYEAQHASPDPKQKPAGSKSKR
jgi:hypothetical protein